MMMTAAQIQAVKRNLLAAQVSYKRSELNEKSLYVELHNFFQHLKKTVLHELREYWKDDDSILLEGQLDLILAPIFESQQEYYNILRKHNIKEYNSGCREARRLVKLTRKNVSSHKSENNTIKTNNLLKLAVDKDELFGTNDWTQQRLLDQSFTASEGTMNRVDKDINKIISDGYQSGAGINKVAANIETRFEQLKTWEAKRIARTEIHNAHQMGIMNTYYDMGVEYTQWSSAHDSRVRGLKPKDKANHVKMDGEIIPLGGTYSNGLQYPGDTKGPIYEWINCRCGNVPYIIPDGYMAPPGMAQFREEDLIQTLDYWNQDDLIAQATQEAQENISAPSLSPENENQMKDWYDMFHKVEQREPPEVFYETTLKNRYLKSVEANVYHTEELTPRMLTEVKALEKYYPGQYNRMVKEITKEVDYNRLSPANLANYNKLKSLKNLEPWQKEVLEKYEIIARDTNIRAEEVILDLKSHNPRMGHGLGSSYYDAGSEAFIKYNFKDKSYSIYISKNYDDMEYMSHQLMNVDDLIKRIEKQPKILQDSYKKICFSSQRGIKHIESGRGIGGWSNTRGNVVIFTENGKTIEAFLSHEGAHNLEEGIRKISKDPKFRKAFETDMSLRRKGKIKMTDIPEGSVLGRQSDDKIWISHYAEFPITSKNTEYIEAWADLVKAYVHEPKWLKQNYRNTYDYIDEMFKKYEKSPNGVVNKIKKLFRGKSKLNTPTIKDELIINKDKTKIVKIDPKIKNNTKVKVDSLKTYRSYSDNAQEKIDFYVKSQNLNNQHKSKLAIWSGTGAKLIKAFQLNDFDTIQKGLKEKGCFFEDVSEIKKITLQLKSIINKRGNSLGENIILFKGIKSEDMDLSKFVVGEVNKFDTHMSTTLNLDTAKKFAKDLNDNGYIVVMYTHKKVKGAAISGSFNLAPEEYEILLSESQKYITNDFDEINRILYIFVG